MAAKGEPAAFFAGHQGVARPHQRPHILEAYRRFVHLHAVGGAQLVEGLGGGYALNQRAAPALVRQQIAGQQRKDVQRCNEPPLLVDDAHPVGVSVQGDADGGGGRGHPCQRLRQIGGDGFRLRHSRESRIAPAAQFFDAGSSAGQQLRQQPHPGPMHRIHHHPEPGAAQQRQVHQFAQPLPVRRQRVDFRDQLRMAGGGDDGGVRRRGAGDGLFQAVGDFLGGAAAVFRLELEAVPGGGVVAGGDDGGAGGLVVQHIEAGYRRGRPGVGQIDRQPGGGADPGDSGGEFGRQKAGIVADHQPPFRRAALLQEVAQPLGAAGHIRKGVFLGDAGAPAIGAKAYGAH